MSSVLPSPQQVWQQVQPLLKKPVSYITERLDKVDIFDETNTAKQKESPWYDLGGIAYLFWILTVITGIVLVMGYIPTVFQAYDSIIGIKEDVLYSIIRGCHKYGGDALIIAATLRVYRMWFNAEYKNRGELNFIIAMVVLLAGMYSGLSGYLLIWNQRAFWATKIFATFPTYLDIQPAVSYWFVPNITGWLTHTVGELTHQGMNVSQILLGGTSISQATMTRFFSLHFAISLIGLVATELYFYQRRLKRLNLSWPKALFLISILVFTAIVLPAEMGSRANPEVTPLPILSDWYFLALYQLLKYMDPYWATIWTVAIPVTVIGMTFLDFGNETNPWRRPIFTTSMISGFIGFIVFSFLIIFNIADINRDPPWWYAQIALVFTIGELWHFVIYKDIKVWMVWAVPNFVLSAWLYFLYVFPYKPQEIILPWAKATFPPEIAKHLPAPFLEIPRVFGIIYSLPETLKVSDYHKTWLTLYLGFGVALVLLGVVLTLIAKKHQVKQN